MNPQLRSVAASLGLAEPALEPGHVRLRWSCCCGSEIWDDFKFIASGPRPDLDTCMEQRVDARQRSQVVPTRRRSIERDGANTAIRSPRSNLRPLPSSASAESTTTDQRLWMYGIFQPEKFTDELVELRVSTTTTDQMIFGFLYSHYQRQRNPIYRFFSMRGVKKISLARFVRAPRMPDVHEIDDWPTDEASWLHTDAHPRHLLPKVGHNHLLHLWRYPSRPHGPINHASSASLTPGFRSHVFLHVPKKIGAPLKSGSIDAEQGWALYFEEGVDLRSMYIMLSTWLGLGCAVYFCARQGLISQQCGTWVFGIATWMGVFVVLAAAAWRT